MAFIIQIIVFIRDEKFKDNSDLYKRNYSSCQNEIDKTCPVEMASI